MKDTEQLDVGPVPIMYTRALGKDHRQMESLGSGGDRRR